MQSRVRLRRLELGDAPAVASFRSDPEVARYQSWEAYSLADAELLCAAQEGNEIGTPGTWSQMAIVLVESGEVIGDCGLRFPGLDEPGRGTEIEIGITLGRAFHGRGLATESLACIIELAFGRLKKRAIHATVDAANVPAAALLMRAGFSRAGDEARRVWFKGAWGEEWDYVLRRSEEDPTNAVSAAR